MRSLQSGRSAGIKLAGKKYTVAVWDQDDYLKDTKKQLSDEKYKKKNLEFLKKMELKW